MSLIELYRRELSRHQFKSDADQATAVRELDALRERLLAAPGGTRGLRRLLRRAPAAGGGLYLWGSVGRGKTWLVNLFFDSLDLQDKHRTHFHHFMRDVHSGLRAAADRPEPLRVVATDLARRYRVLCLDELLVQDIADAMILAGLFKALLAAGTSLVITSNTPPRDLYRDGLQRARFLPAIALLESQLSVHELRGKTDYRLRELQRAPIYIVAKEAAAARKQLAKLYARLAGEHGEHQAELHVAGRPIAAWRRAADVVWFGFDALCEGARSQNDYVEIADEFHTVFLSDVPVFTEQDDDAARRFIALIDEFYDQGVKLVLSAAAPPEQLYRGQRLKFDFQRTASRLTEMQTEAYLKRAHQA